MTDAEIRRVLSAHRSLLTKARYGGLDPEHALLLVLIGDRTLTVGELMWDCYFGTSTAYALDKLQERMLVVRKPSREDRRSVMVARTPAGAAIARAVRKQLPKLVAA